MNFPSEILGMPRELGVGARMTDTINAGGTSDEDWFFTEKGQREGPVTTAGLLELLRAEKLDGDTPVWRKGLADWQPLRTTELGAHLQNTPPPVAAAHVNNGLVWALAVAPIAYVFVEVAIYAYQMNHQDEDVTFSTALSWVIPLLVNGSLCLLDERQLKRAGYSSGWLTFFALLLAPVYLFMRAQRLRQTPTYGFVWIASFIISIVLRAM